MSQQQNKTMIDRLLSALWVPVVVIVVTAALISGIGELLLALAKVKPEAGAVKEPISVIVALIIAMIILLGATWLARGGRRHG